MMSGAGQDEASTQTTLLSLARALHLSKPNKKVTNHQKMTVIEQPNKITASVEIKVLTLNIWGIPIPFVSKNRPERVEAIANYIATGTDDYDFVFLQEVWSRKDFKLIATKVSKVLPYSHYFYSGVIGSGTCILSRSPLRDAHFHRWSLNGYPHKIHHGDWFGGKGVGICRTERHGISFLLANTHLNACYCMGEKQALLEPPAPKSDQSEQSDSYQSFEELTLGPQRKALHAEYKHENDEYIHHRVVQAYETSQLMRMVKHRDDMIIFAGDLNATPKDISYRLIKWNSRLVDAFNDCSTKPVGSLGETNETPANSYTAVKRLINNPSGHRIDHIFYRAAASYQVTTRVCDQPLPVRVPNQDFSFSDHEAVRAILTITPAKKDAASTATTTEVQAQTDALLDAAAICNQGLKRLNSNKRHYLTYSFALGILQIVFLVLLSLDGSLVHSVVRFFIGLSSIVLMFVLCYCLMMAIIGHLQEYSGVLSAKLGIEVRLEQMRVKNARIFEEERKRTISFVK